MCRHKPAQSLPAKSSKSNWGPESHGFSGLAMGTLKIMVKYLSTSLWNIYIYIWLLCWADKTSSENKGTSTDLFRILRIQNLGVWPWALGLYAKYILQLYPHIYNIWVNYNNSLTWTVGPFGDDFPNYDSRLRENSEVVIWAPTFISYMSEIIEIQRSPSTLLLRITMALKTQSPDTTNRDAIKWCFQK